MKNLILICLFVCFSQSFGAQWEVLYPNVMTIAFGVSAPDNQRIYVSGGDNGGLAAVLKSDDEGATWRSLSHDFQLMYLDVDVVSDGENGIAASLGFYGQVASASYTNDGETFFASPHVPFFSGGQSVHAFDSQTSFYVGAWLDSIRDEYTDGIIVTNDGGKTLQFVPWLGGTQARYGAFVTNSTWFLAGGTWGTEKIHGSSENFQISSRININVSKEGKKSVQINTKPLEKNGYLAVLRKTVDGGNTFTTVFNQTGFYFNGISCVDARSCWVTAEGPEGAWIYYTQDGGANWVDQFFVAGASLIDVKMVSELEGWAVGAHLGASSFSSLFLHTLDAGNTWTESTVIEGAFPNNIDVVNSNRAYATAFLLNGLSSILVYRD